MRKVESKPFIIQQTNDDALLVRQHNKYHLIFSLKSIYSSKPRSSKDYIFQLRDYREENYALLNILNFVSKIFANCCWNRCNKKVKVNTCIFTTIMWNIFTTFVPQSLSLISFKSVAAQDYQVILFSHLKFWLLIC